MVQFPPAAQDNACPVVPFNAVLGREAPRSRHQGARLIPIDEEIPLEDQLLMVIDRSHIEDLAATLPPEVVVSVPAGEDEVLLGWHFPVRFDVVALVGGIYGRVVSPRGKAEALRRVEGIGPVQ